LGEQPAPLDPAGALDGADFTLASKYQYNQTLRVDFSCTWSI
jgi:hypothetical protein